MGNSITPHIENAQKTGVCSLKGMKLKQLPPEFSKLPKSLRTLDLSENNLKILPEAIVHFVMLKTFSMNNNQLESLTTELDKMIKLETLSLASNLLKKFSLNNAAKLKNLRTVTLSGNRLKEFPKDLCNLPALDALDLSGNFITLLPEELKTLKTIELNLNKNRLNALTDSLCACERLKVLRVEENCLPLEAITVGILKKSQISLIAFEGNLFDMKNFQEVDGYEEYIARYSATKKKFV